MHCTEEPLYAHRWFPYPVQLKEKTYYLAGTVQATLESWLAEVVGLQLALDDISRVDAHPVHRSCCPPSQHQGALAQLGSTLQSLTPTK